MTAAELDAIILSFEQSWQRREPWLPEQFVERCGALPTQERRELLLELVAIDVEYRWRQQAAEETQFEPLTLDQYARQIPELRDPPLEMIAEEYRCRARGGGANGAGESLLRRYPSRKTEIRNVIASVDDELRVEQERTVDWREESKTDRSVIKGLCESRAELELLDWSDYVLQKRIGAGRTGHIYRALQRSTGQTVAIKFLRKSFWSDQRITSRFLDEAGISREPVHPGLLPLHGFGRTPR
jgi:hypothetical protein